VNETLQITLTIYAICLISTAGLGGILVGFGTWKDQRLGARVALLSPIWPVVLVCGLRGLWNLAEWGRP